VKPVLSIVIPALDEEAAIGDTVRRCLEARAEILADGVVGEVEILVVNDGSSDRTEEIARSFDEVCVLGFDRNRGYGAAIQSGFDHARGDWLAFLDADGTCDPRFFKDLCRALEESGADLALGSRMGPQSRMPWLRALGNAIFAWILGVLSRRDVGDTASGMRVIRRACLPDLEPLPDGLHFTPAMSARVLLEGKLRLVERPMPYAERVGRSKLSVARDGVRFLTVIVQAATTFRPARPLLLLAALVAAGALATGALPVAFWLRHARLEEWMIYRIMLASLLATAVAMLVCAAVVAERIASVTHQRPAATSGPTAALARLFTRRARLVFGALCIGVAVAVVWPGLVEYASRGEVSMHWSRAMLASLLVVIAVVLGITTFLLDSLDLIERQRAGAAARRPPDRVRPARAPDARG
jgi:hypothetical protein